MSVRCRLLYLGEVMSKTSSYFSSEFFAGNRRALQARVQQDVPIVVTANGLLQRGADSSYGFSQDANFWYLTGIDEPDITMVMDGDEVFLIVPVRDMNRATFDGSIDEKRLAKRSGITRVVDEMAGWKRLGASIEKHGKIATPAAAPNYLQQYGMYANPSRSRLIEQMQQYAEDLTIIDIRADLAHMRMYKQEPELLALQRAIDVTAETLNEVTAKPQLATYQHEYELEAAISHGFRSRGASGHSFEPIVAGGKNACVLHNVANNDALHSGDMIVCDVGAEVEHYAADVTRTVATKARTPRQKAVYDAVREVQAFGLELLKPGADLRTFEDKVAARMGKYLKALGLITRNDHESVRKYFPHATSHFLGLNVHDVGDYTRPLKPGVVLTCEPGIYIPEEGIGVRIEDDVLITEKSNRVLSAACRK